MLLHFLLNGDREKFDQLWFDRNLENLRISQEFLTFPPSTPFGCLLANANCIYTSNIGLYLWKLPFNSHAISNFRKTCKRFVWLNKVLHHNAFWQLIYLNFNHLMYSVLKFSSQLHLIFLFHFIFFREA